MILKTSIDSKSKFFEIQEVCGESFNLIEKFSYGVFGSLRYRIKNIFTKTTLSEISNYNSIVYAIHLKFCNNHLYFLKLF